LAEFPCQVRPDFSADFGGIFPPISAGFHHQFQQYFSADFGGISLPI
jgi:hypothetical protein